MTRVPTATLARPDAGPGSVLVVRLDSLGDVLVCGPAVRAVVAGASRVVLLTGPAGEAAARLLPGVDAVLTWRCPWILAEPPALDRADLDELVERIRAAGVDEAVVLTSYHQSALPTALMLRLAGVRRITAVSEDYPGSLLDVRVPPPPDAPEPERMLAIARAAGFELPAGDDGRLAVCLPSPAGLADRVGLRPPYVVLHPGTSAPARAYPAPLWSEAVRYLAGDGWQVVVTGSDAERELTAEVVTGAAGADRVLDLCGWLSVAELGVVLADAAAVAVANTGPAHLAAAVGTPVVSLFAPVVSARRWLPYGVPLRVLGDQQAACRDTRARACPVPGHPCLSGVAPAEVARAVAEVARTAPLQRVPA